MRRPPVPGLAARLLRRVRALPGLGRAASALPIPRPGESLPAATPPFSAAPLLPRRAPARAAPGRLRASLSASLAEGAAAEVFAACAGGAVLTGWALYLGASPMVIGLLGALPLAAQVLHVPAAWLTQAVGRKTLAVLAVGAARLVWLPVVALPFLPLGREMRLALFVAVVGLAAVLGVVGNNAWTAWMGDLVPGGLRGRYFGQRTVYLAMAGTIASLAAAVVLDLLGPRGFQAEALAGLALVACGAGALSVYLLSRQHEPPPDAHPVRVTLGAFGQPLRDERARRYVWYQLGWNAAIAPAAAFVSVYMLRNLELGFVLTAAHGVGVAVVRIASASSWGRAVDRFGARPVLVVCSFGIALVPLMWVLAVPGRLWPIAVEAVVSGLLWGGHGIAAFDLGAALAPRAARPFYLAAFATAGGIGFGLASGLAGLLAEALPERIEWLGLGWANLQALFLVSAVARAAAAGLALRVVEPEARSVGALVRTLLGALRLPGSGRRRRR